jgi:hypothetical protein
MGLLAGLAIGRNDVSGRDKSKEASSVGDLVIGEPIRHENLTVFPLSSRKPKQDDRFLTLDQGLKEGSVEITEVGRGADVNHLLVLNKSRKPLYLMPGEIIVGGRQDRTIAQERVIAPGGKPVLVEVFCVEHGRWSDRGQAETARLIKGANSTPELAESSSFASRGAGRTSPAVKADGGEFIGSVGSLSKAARLAVQDDKNQQKVWQKVGEVNAKSSNESQSGDFTGNYTDKKIVKQLEPYIKALQKSVAEQKQVVGVAVAVDGKLETLDVFESTPLFRQLWPKLLKSYALDAANAVADAEGAKLKAKPGAKMETAPPKSCTVDDARRFLAEALSGKGQQTDVGGVSLTSASTEHLITFSAQDSRRSRETPSFGGFGGFGGGFGGGAVHASGFAK